jgi:hypothetical protein
MSKISVTTVEAESLVLGGTEVRDVVNIASSQANTALNQSNSALALANSTLITTTALSTALAVAFGA